MGEVVYWSVFCILCFIRAKGDSDPVRRVIHDVKFMKSGTEFTRILDSSPTGVFRALNDIYARLRLKFYRVVTEKLFEKVVEGWIQQLQTSEVYYEQSDFQIREYHVEHRADNLEGALSYRLILLTNEKMKHYVATYEGQFEENEYSVVIGTCLSKYVMQRLGVKMVIPVQTKNWIYPVNSNHGKRHWVKSDKELFLVQHTSINSLRAISLKCHMDYCDGFNQTRYLYGSLQHVSIGGYTGQSTNVLGYSSQKDGKGVGFVANVMEYLFGYLKLKLYWAYQNENGTKAFLNYDNNWLPDFPTTMMVIYHARGIVNWPPLYRDGVTVLSVLKSRDMTLARLISIFKNRVWIATIVILLLFNLGFYFLFDGSPSLRNNPKVKHKNMSKVMRILLFDSLIRFQEEWQTGPTQSVRILLVAFNIFHFIILNAFLALFSVQILSRRYFPFSNVYDVCQYQGSSYLDYDAYFTLQDKFTGLSDKCLREVSANTLNYMSVNSNDNFDCLSEGSCIFLTFSHTGNLAISNYPGVHLMKKNVFFSEMTIPFGCGLMFKNSFSQLVMRMRENGILQVLQEHNFKTQSRSSSITEEAITFSETWLTMSILAIGIFAAAFILVAEKIIGTKR